jgi:hypothetical protein
MEAAPARNTAAMRAAEATEVSSRRTVARMGTMPRRQPLDMDFWADWERMVGVVQQVATREPGR